MLLHLVYRPLTLGDLEGHSDITKFQKCFSLPRSLKFYIFVVYRFHLKNKFWGQSVHFWSCDTTKHYNSLIRLAKSQPIFKIETFDLDHI